MSTKRKLIKNVTLVGIRDYLNEHSVAFKKRGGKPVTTNDIVCYAKRGHLPFHMGCNIIQREESNQYLKLYSLLEEKAKIVRTRKSKSNE